MAEIIELLVQSAVSQKPVVDQPVTESPEICSQRIIITQKFRYLLIDGPGTRVSLHDDPHLDSPLRCLLERRCQGFISEVIGNPENFTTRRDRMNPLFQKVAQEPGGTIRPSPENLKGLLQRLMM